MRDALRIIVEIIMEVMFILCESISDAIGEWIKNHTAELIVFAIYATMSLTLFIVVINYLSNLLQTLGL